MSGIVSLSARHDAVDRAERFSPFLREACRAHPEIVQSFFDEGPVAASERALAVEADDVENALRRRRAKLALAVALGDLAGELSFEQATRLLSDFADQAIGAAVRAAVQERVPGAEPDGFTVIAMEMPQPIGWNFSL